MIYIFSSTHYELFKQNILNACCYPRSHVMRVRYDEKYLTSEFRERPRKFVGMPGVLVFAEGAERNKTADSEHCDYRFLPVRRCTVRQAQNVAGIVILDLELEDFVDYGDDSTWEDTWDRTIKSHANRPHLKGRSQSDGYYVYEENELPGLDSSRPGERAWRSLIDRLNRSELADCVTYRVLGFFRLTRAPINWFKLEWEQKPAAKGADSTYRFRTGETILMKILFYGEANKRADGKALKIEFDPKTFTSISAPRLLINGRYNEERVLLPTVRGTDTVVSTLSIVQAGGGGGTKSWAPQPTFVVCVGPSRLLVSFVILLFTTSFVLASLSKFEELAFLREVPWLVFLVEQFNPFPKAFAGVCFLLGSWLYLRKFPLK